MSSFLRFRPLLRALALLLALGALGFWLARGAHPGWTQTTVTHLETDEITGLEFPVEVERFVPGVELLGLSLLAAATLAGLSFWPRRRPLAAS
jgi:hypothetical protein